MTDQEQFAQLTSELAWLRRLARTLLGDVIGPDLAHDTWLIAAEHAPQDGRPLRPWIVRVARNAARMARRSDHRRERRELATADTIESTPTPEELVARAEAQRRVVEAVLGLTEPHRSTVLLHYFEELSSAEIARRLSVPDGTVRRRLKEALDQLRETLGASTPERRKALLPLLVPLASSKSVPLTVGALAMKKLIALLVALVAVFAIGFWLSHRRHRPIEARASTGAGLPAGADSHSRPIHGATDPLAWMRTNGLQARAIAGRVTFEGTPAIGAKVTITDPAARSGARPPLERRTDQSGHFDFGTLPPLATYQVAASAPNRSSASAWVNLGDPTARPPSDQLELVLGACGMTISGTAFDAAGNPVRGLRVVRDGAVTDGDEHGAYKLCAARGHEDVIYTADGYGSVSLSVDVQGDVKQDVVLVPEAILMGRVVSLSDGKPVADALVRARIDRHGADHPSDASTVSDNEGRFRINALVPDRYRVDAIAAEAKSAEVRVVARVGGGAEVELAVQSLGRITGHVLSEGKPVVGEKLSAIRTTPIASSDEAVSQPDGAFVIEHVPIGELTLSGGPFRIVRPSSVRLKAASTLQLELETERTATVRGHVTRRGSPAQHARVCCVRSFTGGPDSVSTDADGAYEFTGVRPGAYHVAADNEELGASTMGTALTVNDSSEHIVDLEMDLASSIAGTVVDQTGSPVVGALVRWSNTSTGDLGKSITDKAGDYRCGRLTGGGRYRAAVSAGPNQRSYPTNDGSAYPELEVPDGATNLTNQKIMVLVESLSISGRVVDTTGVPMADAMVKAIAMPVSGAPRFDSWIKLPMTFTDGDGNFTLSALPAGAYGLNARSVDGGEGATLNVAAGETSAIIQIERPGAIDGTLTGFDVTPVVYASDVTRIDNSPEADRVDANTFYVSGVRSGRYVVSASTEHDGDAQLVEIRAGQTAHVTPSARGRASLDVVVLDFKTRTPIAGAACHVTSSAGGTAGLTNWSARAAQSTDAHGHALLEPVPAGAGLVLCVMPSGAMSLPSADVTLVPGTRGSAQLLSVTSDPGYKTMIGAGFDWRNSPPRFATVDPNGPAAKSGLLIGDLVTGVDGASVEGLNGLGVAALIAGHASGTPITIAISRGGSTTSVSVIGQPQTFSDRPNLLS